MPVAVVPVRNEEQRLSKVLAQLAALPLDLILLVINGCSDASLEVARKSHLPNLQILYWDEALGLDVPRAVGAFYAWKQGTDAVLFLDGDMVGWFPQELRKLLTLAQGEGDLVLTDCYPRINHSLHHDQLLQYRLLVNQSLGLSPLINVATPSHGPHAVSRRLLDHGFFEDFAVPPLILVRAVQHNLSVRIGATIPHLQLGSRVKSKSHGLLMRETIIGDCLEALAVWEGRPRTRALGGMTYSGYDPLRRRDLLQAVIVGHHPLQRWLPNRSQPDLWSGGI